MDRPVVARPSPETTPSWAGGARRRLPFYLLAALLLAGLAGFLTFFYLDGLRARAVPTRLAVVARLDIRPGTLIDGSMIEGRLIPEAVLPSNALASPEQVVGRVVVVPLVAREVILASKLIGGEGRLSSRLPDGRWAMILPSGWLASPVPELAAGDRLDLLAYQPGASLSEAAVIVSAVEVLTPPDGQDSADGLALAVTLDQASAVVYARGNGFLILPLLRPQGG